MNNETLPSFAVNKSSTTGEIPSSPTPYEEERLSVLQSFDLLNQEPIPILDILCKYTATHCGVPTAAITLVDREKILLKSVAGEIKPLEIERTTSFCANALMSGEKVFVVPDTFLDPRFASNPQVTQEPFIRFYASARLTTTTGQDIGCFCIMDTKPGTLSEEHAEFLTGMAKQVIKYLEGEKTKKDLARLLFLEKEVYNKLLLTSANLASAAPTFDEALQSMILHLDPKLGWLSARIRNMQTGGTTGITYNPILPEDPELPLLWNRLDSQSSHPRLEVPQTDFINSAPLRPEYSHLVVPVRIRERLVAVMEFLYPDHRNADPRIRDVFNLIAANLSIVAERELLNIDLKYKSEHDHNSGAPNRELFVQRLDRILQEGSLMSNRKLVLFCFDINGFQSISDDFGYEAGVEVLREITRRASKFCSGDDTIGRLVGGEFLLLIHEREPYSSLELTIKRVIANLSGEFLYGDASIDIQLSIGCVALGSAEGSSAELIRRAEEAMHRVKSGQNRGICVADEQVMREFLYKRAMNRTVKDAVKNNRISLYYQPIVELATGRIVGAEALMRLVNQDGKTLEAKDFIDSMHRMRLLGQIDAWVISEVLLILKDNKSFRDKVPDFYFSHNVTPEVICREDFHEHFIAQVERSGAPANGIHIEITEQSIIPNNQIPNNQIPNNQIPNNQILINNLKVMKDYGIKVSLDDFGTGYSNLQIIAQYPVDIIKIDRSFLTGIVSGDTVMNNLLRSITDIAKNFGCSMVAEGIEQQAEAEHLLSLGCTHGQGYLFGKPMPLKELHALVMKQSG